MTDLTSAITPKSDQLNADDLIGGPRTITITRVTKISGEQPVSIHYEGDGGKPYKPCKSMIRVLVLTWGADALAYTGRQITLFRDPTVMWGGQPIGGIRISHMSHIDSQKTMALTATRGQRKPYTVKPLSAAPLSQPSGGAGSPPSTKPAPSPSSPEDFVKFGKRRIDPARPEELVFYDDMDESEWNGWSAGLRKLIERAPDDATRDEWARENQGALLVLSSKLPARKAWVLEPLSGVAASGNEGAPEADGKAGSDAPSPSQRGAA